MVSSDDWTRCAMRDGEVVAELLVTLKEAKVITITNPTLSVLRWGIRQPRSRSPRKEAESRCSPSTPLSWSGGCGPCGGSSSSPSGYVDGYEATSRRMSAVRSRSKVLVTADLDFDVKRLQRKKDIASLRSPFSENKNLKRMKIDHSHENLLENENCKADGNFLLPDLNIMPCEESGDHYSSLGVETTPYGIMIIK